MRDTTYLDSHKLSLQERALTLSPLVVDLDGTLILGDTLHESALRILRDSPLAALRIPFWLIHGKAVLKRRLAERVSFDASSLPYNPALLEWLQEQQRQGRKLVLCTASDYSVARAISDHLGLFDEIIASDGTTNLAGKHKADALENRYGRQGFDYVGNSSADVAVWRQARRAIVVNASEHVTEQATAVCEIEKIIPPKRPDFAVWRRALRIHQWTKNALLFVALFASHQLTDADAWQSLIVAFCSFSICASSVYIANDLFDLDSDRQHPRKRNRPFAAGSVPVWKGVVLAPLLFLTSIALGQYVGGHFLSWLVFYFVLTCAYSWGLKRLVLIDCLTLSVLYTLRIIAGAAAAGLSLSFWLLAFSGFLFLSLAFVKRYAELQTQQIESNEKVHGRGYYSTDAPLVQMLGIASGYSSVVVLALYLNSDTVLQLYRTPELVWGAVPVMLFWISWMWMQAHRGKMHDDPVVYAVKDKASLLAGVMFATVLVIATIGIQW